MSYFTAHTFNCVCHSISSMFRVLGIYNFGVWLCSSAKLKFSFSWNLSFVDYLEFWLDYIFKNWIGIENSSSKWSQYTSAIYNRKLYATRYGLRGHSTTTWTKFTQFWPLPPLCLHDQTWTFNTDHVLTTPSNFLST